jgi:hypothetical protein
MATEIPAIKVRTTLVPNPKIILGSTSTPYAQAKKVSDKDFQPGEVTMTIANEPNTTTLENVAIIALRLFFFFLLARRASSWELGCHWPPKS